VYQLLISDESKLDILDAFSWYESQQSGLGVDFELCLEAGFDRILKEPLLFQTRYRNLHIHFIGRFPYGIHYRVEDNLIKVFGIFHMSRNPVRWTKR